jgi:hypothetical protein
MGGGWPPILAKYLDNTISHTSEILRRMARSKGFSAMFRHLVGAVILGGVTLIATGAQSDSDLIIQVRPGVAENAVRQLSKEAGAELQHSLGGPAFLVRVTPPQDTDAVMDRLRANKDVISVERNQPVHTQE